MANTVIGIVSVIPLRIENGIISQTGEAYRGRHRTLWARAHSERHSALRVELPRSDSVSVIDTASDTVIQTISGVGSEPRGIAITNDGDDDNDEAIYVTQFLSLPVAGKVDGQDDAKAGHVTVISAATNTITASVTIDPIADTGFKALGDAIGRIPPGDPTNPANFLFTTGTYPISSTMSLLKGTSRLFRT